MRLGSETGSLINHVMAAGPKVPEVGMGATLLHWTDRDAGTVVAVERVKGGTVVTVQEDTAKRSDDGGYFTESQAYAYEPNPDGAKHHFRLMDEAPGWVSVEQGPTGRWRKGGRGSGVSFGARRSYRDPSF